MNQMPLNLAFNIVLILRSYDDDHGNRDDDNHDDHDDDDHDNPDENDIFEASYQKNQKLHLFQISLKSKPFPNVTLMWPYLWTPSVVMLDNTLGW